MEITEAGGGAQCTLNPWQRVGARGGEWGPAAACGGPRRVTDLVFGRGTKVLILRSESCIFTSDLQPRGFAAAASCVGKCP